MRTRVVLSIDTEFSIGGALRAGSRSLPVGAQNVLCNVQGKSEGLGFMLETFAASDLKATFFVETLQTAYFGDEPMAELARRIAQAGHDVQLHLHPVWTYFDHPNWQDRLATVGPTDNMHDRGLDELVAFLRRGIDALVRWGLPAPIALRTGNLMVDRNVYRAMAQVGMKISSNIARAVFEPAEPALRLNAGVHEIEGILELPVLTYADLAVGSRKRCKSLTVTGTSLAEAACLLDRAHREGVKAVVLLTHCHEFVKGDMQGRLAANRVNQRRLAGLCKYLQDSPDRFEVVTMGQLVDGRLGPGPQPDPLLGVPPPLAMHRMVQNKLSELMWT